MLAAGMFSLIAATSSRASRPVTAENPLRNPKTRKPLSCPDPSVIDRNVGGYRMVMTCTSDFAGNAFPIWVSRNGVSWTRLAYVFPEGHQPWWALAAGHGGRYWGPDLQFIGGQWVLYFAALANTARAGLSRAGLGRSSMVIGVAATHDLRSGRWGTRLLHYRGQFNAVAGNEDEQETYGGVIDPDEFQDPTTGQRYLVYAEQHTWIWLGELSANGLQLAPNVRSILTVNEPWDCQPRPHDCTIEGPMGYYHAGVAYVLFSAGGTWTGTYEVGVAASVDPAAQAFVVDPAPILVSSRALIGPGGTSQPILDPEGNTVIYFHALLGRPDLQHVSADRYLAVSRFSYAGGSFASLIDHESNATVQVAWPAIGSGQPTPFTTMERRGER